MRSEADKNRTYLVLGFVLVGGLLLAVGIGVSILAEIWWLPLLMVFLFVVSLVGFAVVELQGRAKKTKRGGGSGRRRTYRSSKPVSARDKYK